MVSICLSAGSEGVAAQEQVGSGQVEVVGREESWEWDCG